MAAMEEFIYVSCKEGVLVPRFPSLQSAVTQYIGAIREQAGKGKRGSVIKSEPNAVVAIPAAEWARYRREYGRKVKDGALILKKKVDFTRWQKAREEASAALVEENKKTNAADKTAEGDKA